MNWENDFLSTPPVLILQFINEPKETMFVKSVDLEVNVIAGSCVKIYVLVSATFLCGGIHFICFSRTNLATDEFFLYNDLYVQKDRRAFHPNNCMKGRADNQLTTCFYILKELIE
jgi:hypothetical protein